MRFNLWLYLSDLALFVADFGQGAHRWCVRRASDAEAVI